MSDIKVMQMPSFKRAYKRLHPNQKEKVDEAVGVIVENPNIGQEKKGDLAGVFVHKFLIHQQEYLLAYERDSKSRLLLALGVHQKFYRDLKKLPA